jgi:hypothetical protein
VIWDLTEVTFNQRQRGCNQQQLPRLQRLRSYQASAFACGNSHDIKK